MSIEEDMHAIKEVNATKTVTEPGRGTKKCTNIEEKIYLVLVTKNKPSKIKKTKKILH